MTSTNLFDWASLPLGRAPHVPDARDLKLSSYVDADKLVDSNSCPLAHSWDTIPTPSGQLPSLDTDPLGNKVANCCVFSAVGHMVKAIGQQTGVPITVTEEDVLNAYSIGGYKLDPKLFDNGFNVRVMLKIWKVLGLFGTKALGYAAVNWNDPREVALASWLGCGVIAGFNMPLTSQEDSDRLGQLCWSIPVDGFPPGKGPGSWGRHCVWLNDVSPALSGGNSWGLKAYMTTPWQQQCCEEMWIVLVDKWKMRDGRAPNGFAFDDLMSDVKARAAENVAASTVTSFLLR